MFGETDRERRAKEGGPGNAKETVSDDLTVIRGLGTASQDRLYAARITSYRRLAGASVEEIREVLGKFARGARVKDWIAEAQERAEKERPE